MKSAFLLKKIYCAVKYSCKSLVLSSNQPPCLLIFILSVVNLDTYTATALQITAASQKTVRYELKARNG